MAKEIIQSIEINIGNTTVQVTLKQANELCDALMALLGKNTIRYSYTPHWSGLAYTVTPAVWGVPVLDRKITIQ